MEGLAILADSAVQRTSITSSRLTSRDFRSSVTVKTVSMSSRFIPVDMRSFSKDIVSCQGLDADALTPLV
ncbi:hypothetical protein ES703_94925 [subsurface metagenome]